MNIGTTISRISHPVRGTVITVVLGPVFVVSAVLAFLALAHNFISGWVPSRWFSHNPFDWLYSFGTEGGAADYITFMVCGVTASLCGTAIRWGFYGDDTSA